MNIIPFWKRSLIVIMGMCFPFILYMIPSAPANSTASALQIFYLGISIVVMFVLLLMAVYGDYPS